MRLLNLGCGAERPADLNWINIDNLHAQFPDPECPERENMDAEPNYLNHDISTGLPFEDLSVDGILMSHLLEHFDLQGGTILLRDAYRVLVPGGVLRISVPDPGKTHRLTLEGFKNWGEKNPTPWSFMEYALFFIEHKQLIGKDALFCMLYVARFRTYAEVGYRKSTRPELHLDALDNREPFSLFVEATK